jgi:oxygen-dependent protoporphyrinogen oxidase
VSVAAFVTRRFGGQVLDKVVDPLLAGTRAGRVEDMSLAAALPQIFGVAHSSRSVIRGLDRASKKGVVDNRRPPFLTVSGGLGRVIETLRDRLPAVDVRMETEAVRLERTSGYTITTNQGSIEAAAVIVATPAYVAAPLLDGVSGGAAAALRTIEHASVASVTLVYEHLDFSPPQGTSGLLVSRSVQQVIAGCTWYSTKWPGSVPDGRSVLRCVVGRAGSDPALETGDDVLSAAVINDVERLLAVHDTPIRTHVTRWNRGLPQYSVGHLQRIDYAENALRRDAPGVMVAGAGLRGSGIPDCIAQGRQAAAAAIRSLQPK